MTPQESHLWYDFLRTYPIQFRRQKQIDRFIVDFYCASAKLVIELDGSHHFTEQGKAYVNERTQMLARHGLRVIRFSNNQVDSDFQTVCNTINRIVTEQVASHK